MPIKRRVRTHQPRADIAFDDTRTVASSVTNRLQSEGGGTNPRTSPRPRCGYGKDGDSGTPNSRSWVATSWHPMQLETRPAAVTSPVAVMVA
jgi:hypothetical protein